jgi:hypothetical protein
MLLPTHLNNPPISIVLALSAKNTWSPSRPSRPLPAMIANDGSKRASTLVRELKTSITMKSEMQKKSLSLWAFRLPVRMKVTRKKVGNEKARTRETKARQTKTPSRIIFNGLTGTRVKRASKEKSPRVPHPRTAHTLATEEIAFWVGPRKDGIVKTNTTSPFILATNCYQLLAADTPVHPPVPVHFDPASDRRTWFSTRADELHRLVVGQTVTSVTNAQKLAHPCKTHRQETNRKKQTNKHLIASSMHTFNISMTQLLSYPLLSPILTVGSGKFLRQHAPIQFPHQPSICV